MDDDPNIIGIDGHILKCKCNEGHIFEIHRTLYYKRKETNTTLCTNCNPISKNVSGLEISFKNFIKNNYDGTILENEKIIEPYEIDIFLPDEKLAFEFNGLYWHSELRKPNYYHKMKTDMCEDKEITLIHIWEDDWVQKREIIESVILNKLKNVFLSEKFKNVMEDCAVTEQSINYKIIALFKKDFYKYFL